MHFSQLSWQWWGPGGLCNVESCAQKACRHGFDEWMDISRLVPFQALMYGVLGSGRRTEAAKLFCIYKLRSECGRFGGKSFVDSGHRSDRVKTAVGHYAPLLNLSYSLMRSGTLLSPPQSVGWWVNWWTKSILPLLLFHGCSADILSNSRLNRLKNNHNKRIGVHD